MFILMYFANSTLQWNFETKFVGVWFNIIQTSLWCTICQVLLDEDSHKIHLNEHQLVCLLAVADPGFPVGGTPTHWGGTNLQRIHFLVKTYVKMKEIDPVGGVHWRRPPGSANG